MAALSLMNLYVVVNTQALQVAGVEAEPLHLAKVAGNRAYVVDIDGCNHLAFGLAHLA
jgi:hypothetical protein